MIQEQKNRDFVQLYRGYIDDIGTLGLENPMAMQVFLFLCKHMDGTNALSVSNTALSELLNVTSRTIRRAVKYLKDNGWICVLKNGTANVYIVNPDVMWTSYGNQKSYCKFQSNILLSSTENAEYLKNVKASSHLKSINTSFIQEMQANKSTERL